MVADSRSQSVAVLPAHGRKLVAVVYADMAGYSRLINLDDAGTMDRLRTLRHGLIDPAVREHGGSVVQTGGDSLLVAFDSLEGAVCCAVKVQQQIPQYDGDQPPDQRIRFRIGINIGDVIPDGTNLHGDGVNIAARLEAMSPIGGICVSRSVRDHVHGRLDLQFEPIGPLTLRNIERPVEAFVLRLDPDAEAEAVTRKETSFDGKEQKPLLSVPDKPSLVVLPFQNMSGDAEQEYFVDGLVEDITTALSRIRSMFVIARNSAFTYKGRVVDVRKVGRELGVRYVMEGSVRKSGDRLRITGQLVAAETGAHLWAARFDGAIDDVFDFQDRITESIAGAIDPRVQLAEIERAQRKPTRDLGAYDWYLRGLAALHDGTEHSAERWLREAQAHFKQAVELDSNYGAAYGMAAYCIFRLKAIGLVPLSSPDTADALRLARLAAQTGRDDARALWSAGATMTYVGQDPEGGILLLERACTLNPNAASAWRAASYARNCLGETEAAVSDAERALRLSPQDPDRAGMINNLAQAHIQAGRFDEAIVWAERGVSDQPTNVQMLRTWVAALALSNREEEARRGMTEVLRLAPHLRLSRRADFAGPFRHAEYGTRMMDAYRRAGMPE